ncbi:MAG TPA: hypothetical protein DHR80_18405, partial [Thalassospira lucentensis]
ITFKTQPEKVGFCCFWGLCGFDRRAIIPRARLQTVESFFMVLKNTVKASVRVASPKHHIEFKTINFGKQGFGKFFSGRVNHW